MLRSAEHVRVPIVHRHSIFVAFSTNTGKLALDRYLVRHHTVSTKKVGAVEAPEEKLFLKQQAPFLKWF